MLTLLNQVYVFAIKNTGQYTTEEKLKQMWVLEPQAFEFAQKCYFKHPICWSTVFLWNNAFLASLKGFNMLQGYPERKKKSKGLTYQSGQRWPDFGVHFRKAREPVLIALNTTSLQFPMSFHSLQIEACFSRNDFQRGTETLKSTVTSNRGARVAVVNTHTLFWAKTLVMCLFSSSLRCYKSNTL